MQLEAGEIRHPRQVGRVARHDLFGGASGGKAYRHHLDPRRAVLRRALLEEEFGVDAVGIADQDVGTAARAAQRAVGDAQVVANDVELGIAGLRKEHLARIGDDDVAVVDAEWFQSVWQASMRMCKGRSPAVT